MDIFSINVLILLGALFYAPVYLPCLLSFFRSSTELRWCFRASSLAAVLLTIVPPPGLVRDTTGQDIAGSFSAASHNIPILFAWIWGGSFILHGVGFWIVCALHRQPKKDAL
jgi:hypothetical protein